LSHFEASQLKEDATAYERRRHLGEGVRAMIGAPVQTAHDNGRRHLREGVWATIGAPVQNNPRANVMAGYGWTDG